MADDTNDRRSRAEPGREPTMQDILADIRRILTTDEDGNGNGAVEAAPQAGREPDRKPDREPTMQDILSTIREILGGDEDKADAARAPAEGAAPAAGDLGEEALMADWATDPSPAADQAPVEPPREDIIASIKRVLHDDEPEPPLLLVTRPPEDEEALMAEWAAMSAAADDVDRLDGPSGDASCDDDDRMLASRLVDGADAERAGDTGADTGGASEEEDDENRDHMAAEWEAMLGGCPCGCEGEGEPETGPVRESTRVLTTDEIDSLLGFYDDEEPQGERSGLGAVLNSALVSYERLPMLEVVFDRLVRMMSTSLRNFTSDNVEVSLDNILSLRFGDYLNSIPLPAMQVVFKAEEWDNYGLLVLDSSLIYSLVDVLLGGRRGTAAMRIEGRPYSRIERKLVERAAKVILSDLEAAFDPISPVTFRVERVETNPRFATISRPSNGAIVTKLRLDMEDRGGRLELLLPYATIEPVRELLLQMFLGEKFGRDPIWETHLAEELWSTEVEVDVELGKKTLKFAEVAELKVGDTLLLGRHSAPLRLLCGGREIGTATRQQDGSFDGCVVQTTNLRSED